METRGSAADCDTTAGFNGFLMWLTETGNEEHRHDYEAGDLPQDGLREGPRQARTVSFSWHNAPAWHRVRVLFDPTTLASRSSRPQALRQLIDRSMASSSGAWQPGNEETIAGVSGLQREDLEQAFREVRVSKKKFEASDIPSVTQLFTPRWIVRFLVETRWGACGQTCTRILNWMQSWNTLYGSKVSGKRL